MLPIPTTPTFYEWVALIQQDSVQASQLVISLQAQLKKQGLMADPALTISIEDYAQAKNMLSTVTSDPDQAKRVTHITRLGQATLGLYPSHDDWVALIREEPHFARELCNALKTKQALLGLQTPQDLLTSIGTYYSLTGQ